MSEVDPRTAPTWEASADPRVFAPDLLGQLSWLERRFTVQFFTKWAAEGRLQRMAADCPNPEARLAQKAFLEGISQAAFLLCVVPLLAVIFGIGAATRGDRSAVITTAVFALIAAVLQIRALARRRRVRQHFAQM